MSLHSHANLYACTYQYQNEATIDVFASRIGTCKHVCVVVYQFLTDTFASETSGGSPTPPMAPPFPLLAPPPPVAADLGGGFLGLVSLGLAPVVSAAGGLLSFTSFLGAYCTYNQ